MIIKGKERGNGAQFGPYLMDTKKNEHVEVHKVSGFMSDNMVDALLEVDAVAQGTRCKNYFFSVVLSPPENEIVDTEVFDDAVSRVADKMGLQDQPYVVVFHEIAGRRHAHCVFSRIDTDKMKAINLPYYKNKLMDISKALYLEHGWKLPQGFIESKKRNPLNFTHKEWQQAERLGDNPKAAKMVLRECWAISDDKASFEKALEQRGYYLAKGDRRGFVAVDWRGKVHSLSRRLIQDQNALEDRLGRPANLPSVEDVRNNIDQELVKRVQGVIQEIKQDHQRRLASLLAQKTRLKEYHSAERQTLAEKQKQRWLQETQQRQARLNKGVRGIWDRITGPLCQGSWH